jgi:hypothetical protein
MPILSDTHPDILRLQIEQLRQMPPWRKLALVGEMNRTVHALALAGLRQRYPGESPERLRRRLADLLLGAELAARAYGPLPEADDPD